MRKESGNKGFTLIELIISIAILSIVGLAIFGFMATSSNLYGREVTQADLQYESQLVINQLQDMLIDASQSVTYFVTSGGTAAEVPNDQGIDESTVTKKEVRIYDGTKYYQVTWDKSEERLYYTEFNATVLGGPSTMAALGAGAVTPGSWEVNPSANHVRMADYVREFSADITNLEKNRSVMFRFLFAINNVSYATQHNITLRNRVVKGEGESGTITVVTPKQEGITISPASIMVWPGDAVAFTHTITSKTGGFPSQEADWSVSASGGSALAPDTSLSGSGELNVSMDEKNPDLTVTVTAKEGVEKADGTVYKPSAAAAVQVKQVQGLTVALTDEGSYKGTNTKEDRLIPGSTLRFKVSSISGPHTAMQDLTATGVTITWEVEKGAEYASVDENGLLTVDGTAPADTILKVRAVFNRAGREWADGFSSEYKVVELKEHGMIFVDPGDGKYIAPEGEIWVGEKQKISINAEKFEEVMAAYLENGQLKPGYRFMWVITTSVKGKEEVGYLKGSYPQGLQNDRTGNNSLLDNLVIGLNPWMQWNTDQRVDYAKIQLLLYRADKDINYYPDEDIRIYESNVINLNVPNVYYLYSYSKNGPFERNLPCLVTDETGEANVYYYIYGKATSEIEKWEHFDSETGYYQVTNATSLITDADYSWKRLRVIPETRTIFFRPGVTKGSSIIRHRVWGDYDDTRVIINYYSSNVEDEGYYVPLPNDTAYRDSGWLFGDCSYAVTKEEATPGGGEIYRLVITDARQTTPKTVTAYWKAGTGTKWRKSDLFLN